MSVQASAVRSLISVSTVMTKSIFLLIKTNIHFILLHPDGWHEQD